jgi:TRAP-type mannitol/chloroaromatic compound transport system substrate-binding protein
MKRRQFLGATGAGLAAAVIASPAIAQSSPEVKWRLTSSFPKSLDTIFGACEVFAKTVGAATDNKFQIQCFAAGEIVPGLQAADAVSNGTVEMAHTASYYYVGKDPTFALFTAQPFGLNARMQSSWMHFGGALDLANEFFKKYNFIAFPAGNTGTQMGGWFRKEIRTVDDIKGLKFRIAGFAGQIFSKMGAVPQQIAGGDIYPALEKGTIDAAEWVGPYDDEKLGLYKVAKYYYYPGWWEGGAMLHNFINIDKWNALPQSYQTIVKAASETANNWMISKYDAGNPGAIKRLVVNGAELRAFPQGVLEASYTATTETYNEISANNAEFKKVYNSMVAFRGDEYLWWQVAELGFDSFMVRVRSRG